MKCLICDKERLRGIPGVATHMGMVHPEINKSLRDEYLLSLPKHEDCGGCGLRLVVSKVERKGGISDRRRGTDGKIYCLDCHIQGVVPRT